MPLTRQKKKQFHEYRVLRCSNSSHVGVGHFLALRLATVTLSQKVGGLVGVQVDYKAALE